MKPTYLCTRLVMLVMLGVLGSCAGNVSIGYSVQSGAALAPTTASGGTTAMLTYHERSGPVFKSLKFLILAFGFRDPDKVVNSTSTVSYSHDSDSTTKTTTTITSSRATTEAEHDERVAMNADLMKTATSDSPIEINLAIASPKLGGTTSGSIAEILYTGAVGNGRFELAVGVGTRSFTFAQRTIRDVTNNGQDTFTTTTAVRDVTADFVGSPVRVTYNVNSYLSAFMRWDISFSNAASPATAGATLLVPIPGTDLKFTFKGFVTTDIVDIRATSLGAESSFVF